MYVFNQEYIFEFHSKSILYFTKRTCLYVTEIYACVSLEKTMTIVVYYDTHRDHRLWYTISHHLLSDLYCMLRNWDELPAILKTAGSCCLALCLPGVPSLLVRSNLGLLYLQEAVRRPLLSRPVLGVLHCTGGQACQGSGQA